MATNGDGYYVNVDLFIALNPDRPTRADNIAQLTVPVNPRYAREINQAPVAKQQRIVEGLSQALRDAIRDQLHIEVTTAVSERVRTGSRPSVTVHRGRPVSVSGAQQPLQRAREQARALLIPLEPDGEIPWLNSVSISSSVIDDLDKPQSRLMRKIEAAATYMHMYFAVREGTDAEKPTDAALMLRMSSLQRAAKTVTEKPEYLPRHLRPVFELLTTSGLPAENAAEIVVDIEAYRIITHHRATRPLMGRLPSDPALARAYESLLIEFGDPWGDLVPEVTDKQRADFRDLLVGEQGLTLI